MNGSRGGQSCFFRGISGYFETNFEFCAISLPELPVCAIFCAFSNYGSGGHWAAPKQPGNGVVSLLWELLLSRQRNMNI